MNRPNNRPDPDQLLGKIQAKERAVARDTGYASELVQFKPKLYLQAIAIIVICTLTGVLGQSIVKPIDQVLIYLAGNVIASARLGRGPSLLYALLSATCFNFFFIEPLYTLEIYDRSYWMTLLVMLGTSVVINSYASQLRLQAIFARKRELYTQTLYAFTREIAATRGHTSICEAAARHIFNAVNAEIVVCLPGQDSTIDLLWGKLPEPDIIKENGLIQWCFHNSKMAGIGTDTMPSARAFYIPLVTVNTTLGVLGIMARKDRASFSAEERSLLETFASLLASAIERANAADTAEKLRVDAEGERLRNTLLSSVSHDLRTPLASIIGSSGVIVTDSKKLSREEFHDLGHSIHQEATRLTRIVSNMLDVTSLESETFKPNKQPYFIEELVGSALMRLEHVLASHTLKTYAEADLPVIHMDGVLIEQVITNLLENAAKYTPAGSTIQVEVTKDIDTIRVRVSDNGPGIPSGNERKIFDKFYTAGQSNAGKGSGLGLAICHAIISAHGGTIWAENKPESGACFSFTLPV